MDLAYYRNQEKKTLGYTIVIYWWNMRSKTLDFKGTLKDCLKKNGITFKRVKHKTEDRIIGYRFKYSQGSSKMTFEHNGDFADGVIKVLQFQLVYLGDKSTISFMSRTRTVNN